MVAAGRHNMRELDTIEQMGLVAQDMARKRLRYRQLIVDNGLPSGVLGQKSLSNRKLFSPNVH